MDNKGVGIIVWGEERENENEKEKENEREKEKKETNRPKRGPHPKSRALLHWHPRISARNLHMETSLFFSIL